MSRRRFLQTLIAAVLTVCTLALSGSVSAQGNSAAAFERVKEVQERHTNELMAKPGVVGTAVGEDQNARSIMLVLVEHGDVPGIPQQLEGIVVRPLVTGRIYALPKGGKPGGNTQPTSDPTSWWPRPVPIGVSTGHPSITAGTIGCRLPGGFVLSNNHVYADENRAHEGDSVLQPGPYDGGGKTPGRDDVIGTLDRYITIDFNGGENTVDAAIVSMNAGAVGNATPADGYGTPKSTPVQARINMPVKKYGRTTGLTKGKVYALNATVDVGYDQGTARFVHQIIITPGSFSAGGDSGSLVVGDRQGKNTDNDRAPVGLLFAGSTLYTVANPIDAVLDAFGMSTIDGE